MFSTLYWFYEPLTILLLISVVDGRKLLCSITETGRPAEESVPLIVSDHHHRWNNIDTRMTDVLGSSFGHNTSERIHLMKTVVSEDDTSLIIYYIGNMEENLFKKRAIICIGFSVVAISLLILYKKVIVFLHGYVKPPLCENCKFEEPPPPYHLFAPPTFEESILLEQLQTKEELEGDESSAMVQQPLQYSPNLRRS